MHKIKEIINNNKMMFMLLVIIAIVTNIVIVYTITYAFSDKSKEIKEVTIEDNIQKSPIVVEVFDEKENNENMIDYINIENEENYITGTAKYYIKVNCNTQTVNIYEKDENNRYSKPVKVMLCSTGIYTPKSGTYEITTYKKEWLALQGDVYGQYCTQIVGNILFHSVPYVEMYNPASLEYWEYDKLGQDASLGCIRLTVENAKWIFDNCDTGTMVEFYSSDNPGPMGKPELEKISNYSEELKNWDPSDKNENNPWIKYKQDIKEQEDRKKKNYDAALQATMNIINII